MPTGLGIKRDKKRDGQNEERICSDDISKVLLANGLHFSSLFVIE